MIPLRPDDPTPDVGSSRYRQSTLAESLRSGPLVSTGSFRGLALGPYVVEGLIARGGMGAVFRAVDQRTNGAVALKVLLAGASASEDQRRRFLREAELTKKLAHEGLVRILDFGQDGNLPWLALEFVEGETLRERLKRRDLRTRSLVRLVARVARAVGHAHQRGVIHRDLKPSNIMIRAANDAPVVADFGVARDLSHSSSLTATGAAVGTPLYMAPEQAAGQEPLPASDVYALGVILYEGLAGRTPFGLEDGPLAVYEAIVSASPQPPSAFAPGLPRALDAVCLKALAKDPAARYPDADALAATLEDWLAGRLRDPRRRKVWLAGIAAALVAAAAGLVVVQDRSQVVPDPSGQRPATGDGVPSTGDVASAGDDPPPGGETAAGPETAGSSHEAPALEPQRLVLQPGPLLGKDTFLRSDGYYWNDNQGLAASLLVGDREAQRGDFRALLQFDLGTIPAGAELRRASLTLWLDEVDQLAGPITVEVRALVASSGARTPWIEGTSQVDERLDGVCWDGALPGEAYPGLSSRRPDLTQPDADEESDFGLGHNGVLARAALEPGSTGSFELDVTGAVARWLADPVTNQGLRVSHAPEGQPWRDGRFSFCSSDHPEPDRRPRLVVEYLGDPPLSQPDLAALYAVRRAEAERLLERARAALEDDQPAPDAFESARRAVEVAPFYGEALFVRGALGERAGSSGALLDLALARSVEEPCAKPDVWALRGELLLRQGNPSAGYLELAEALRLRPDDPRTTLLAAQALLGLGRGAEARQRIEDALRLEPAHPDLLRARDQLRGAQ